MSTFKDAYIYLKPIERGIVTDTGGYTDNGISSKAHPDYDFENSTEQKRYEFFCLEYWLKMNCHLIFSQFIANEVFEAGVNCGRQRAQIWLQKSINELLAMLAAKDKKLTCNIKPLKVDGRIGPITAKAVNNLSRWHNILYCLCNKKQTEHYFNLAEEQPEKYYKYLLGWLNKRVANYNAVFGEQE